MRSSKGWGDPLKRRWLLVLAIIVLLTVSILYGTVFSRSAGVEPQKYENIGIVIEVVSLVRGRYYQPVSTVDLLRSYVATGTINGMLSETLGDPYTRYMDQRAYERMVSQTTGTFGGIGIVIGIRDEQLTIISPIKGTPGERAGLRASDVILKIDGKDTTYMTTDEAASLMRGPEGTGVHLTIKRGDEVIEVPIIRAMINVNSIETIEMIEPSIGYIELTNFSDSTYSELVEALDQLEAEGMKGLILDLRFNPGGTLAAALQVANEFIAQGPLIYFQDRDGNRMAYEAVEADTRERIPMVVLINGSSASASEIVAGALRDHGLAILVGTTTFGKGLIQSIIPLRDGGALTITEQVYLTAGGHDINKVGIEPDIEIVVDEETEVAIYLDEPDVVDPQLEKALEIIREQTE